MSQGGVAHGLRLGAYLCLTRCLLLALLIVSGALPVKMARVGASPRMKLALLLMFQPSMVCV